MKVILAIVNWIMETNISLLEMAYETRKHPHKNVLINDRHITVLIKYLHVCVF